MGTGCIRRAAAGDQDLARTRPYAAINAVMDLVDLGVLAAAEPASALHQIVRLGLYPCAEAVAVKWLLRPDMVVDEIAPSGDRFVGQDIDE